MKTLTRCTSSHQHTGRFHVNSPRLLLISQLFILYPQEMENPLILIHDKKISNMDSLLPALEISIKVTLSIYVSAFGAMTSDGWYLAYVESQASSHCCWGCWRRCSFNACTEQASCWTQGDINKFPKGLIYTVLKCLYKLLDFLYFFMKACPFPCLRSSSFIKDQPHVVLLPFTSHGAMP